MVYKIQGKCIGKCRLLVNSNPTLCASDTAMNVALNSIPQMDRPLGFLRLPSEQPGRPGGDPAIKEETEIAPGDEGDAVLCRQCHAVITQTTERVEVQNAHQHTFANPHGVVFQIRCFQSARGVGHVGPRTDEFSWFAGYSWTVVVCITCLTHLGWRFSLKSGSGFYGLIIDRLIEAD